MSLIKELKYVSFGYFVLGSMFALFLVIFSGYTDVSEFFITLSEQSIDIQYVFIYQALNIILSIAIVVLIIANKFKVNNYFTMVVMLSVILAVLDIPPFFLVELKTATKLNIEVPYTIILLVFHLLLLWQIIKIRKYEKNS